MSFIRFCGPPLVTALLLVACGGGGDVSPTAERADAQVARRTFNAVVSFGDSLSDAGTYTPATLIPGSNPPFYLGGKFTTNSATSTIWVENIAARLGLSITPAEVGFAGQSVRCPSAQQGKDDNCTAYGQGGARVTSPDGIRHDKGALTVPIKTQIANHLERFRRFKPGDLILLWAGANDLLWEVETDPARNPNSFVIRLFTIQAQLEAGAITPAEAQAQIVDAQLASQAAMRTAALEMASYIRNDILAKGGRYVVVLNLPDPATTPEGAAISAQAPIVGAAMTAFSDAFNGGLRDGLKGLAVQAIDIRRFIGEVVAAPAAHGMANASVPACDATLMAQITGGTVTDGFSLFCNATPDPRVYGLRAGADVDSWFFADGNHPTTGGYRLISDEVLRQLRALGWLREVDQ